MLACITCVENNERDSFIQSRTVANAENLSIGEKIANEGCKPAGAIWQESSWSTENYDVDKT